jgi:hypothetical protein
MVLEGRGSDVATDPEDVKLSPQSRRSGRRVMTPNAMCQAEFDYRPDHGWYDDMWYHFVSNATVYRQDSLPT